MNYNIIIKSTISPDTTVYRGVQTHCTGESRLVDYKCEMVRDGEKYMCNLENESER